MLKNYILHEEGMGVVYAGIFAAIVFGRWYLEVIERTLNFLILKYIVYISFSWGMFELLSSFVYKKPLINFFPIFFIIVFFHYIFFSIKYNEDSERIRIQAQTEAERIRLENEKAKDRARWEEELHRKITEEEALARIRHNSTLEMYKAQIDLMIRYKQEGANIDRDIFAMREKLLVLERQENNAMVQDLMNTLDRL